MNDIYIKKTYKKYMFSQLSKEVNNLQNPVLFKILKMYNNEYNEKYETFLMP